MQVWYSFTQLKLMVELEILEVKAFREQEI